MNISVLILTLNEEENLSKCLETLNGFNDIVVLDSFSQDGTQSIAEKHGVEFVQRKFDNWADHQNWAVKNIHFKYPWVFYLDADERMTDELRKELITIVGNKDQPYVAYYCGRKNYFMGRWIRHSMPPGHIMRFFQPKKIRFERLVNPVPVVDGEIGYLESYFTHFNFSKGLTEWIDKHNKYSQLEAKETIKIFDLNGLNLLEIFNKDKAKRRQAIKRASYLLPLRPVFKFVYLYVINRGFLDGYPGLVYCCLQAIYEYFIVLKEREIRFARKGIEY